MTACPCNSGKDLKNCCGPIIDGMAQAETAEALMRSRYTAHVLGNFEHIANTHAPEIRSSYNVSSAKAQAQGTEWIGFEVRDVTDGGPDDQEGTVTFSARYIENEQTLMHRERAEFRREDGVWLYVDGKINPGVEQRRVEKVGRNDPCPCGSGKKFKKCCGA